MPRSQLLIVPLIVSCGLLPLLGQTPPPAEPAKKPAPKLDRYGDPLPEGAVARLRIARTADEMKNAPFVLYSTDGRTLATTNGGNIDLWEPSSGKHVRRLNGNSIRTQGIAFSPDGKTLAFGSGRDVQFSDVVTGNPLMRLRGPDHAQTIAFAPDGKTLASGHSDDQICVWDLARGETLCVLRGDGGGVGATLAFASDGKTLAAGGFDHGVTFWEIPSGKRRLSVHRPPPRDAGAGFPPHLAYIADCDILVSGDNTGFIFYWDASTGRGIFAPTERGDAVVPSPDGKMLASGSVSRHLVQLWEAATGQVARELSGHTDTVSSLAFAPNGAELASASNDGTVLIWSLRATLAGATDRAKIGERLWTELAAADSRTGYAAMAALISAPDKAIPFVKDRLPPRKPAGGHRLNQLIREVASDEFATRERATSELRDLEFEAEPALRRVLDENSSAEAVRRAQLLITELHRFPLHPDLLRQARVVQASNALALRKRAAS